MCSTDTAPFINRSMAQGKDQRTSYPCKYVRCCQSKTFNTILIILPRISLFNDSLKIVIVIRKRIHSFSFVTALIIVHYFKIVYDVLLLIVHLVYLVMLV